jgi:hypothetical protein
LRVAVSKYPPRGARSLAVACEAGAASAADEAVRPPPGERSKERTSIARRRGQLTAAAPPRFIPWPGQFHPVPPAPPVLGFTGPVTAGPVLTGTGDMTPLARCRVLPHEGRGAWRVAAAGQDQRPHGPQPPAVPLRGRDEVAVRPERGALPPRIGPDVQIHSRLVGQPAPRAPDSARHHCGGTPGRSAAARLPRPVVRPQVWLQRWESVIKGDIQLEQRLSTASLLLDAHRSLQGRNVYV